MIWSHGDPAPPREERCVTTFKKREEELYFDGQMEVLYLFSYFPTAFPILQNSAFRFVMILNAVLWHSFQFSLSVTGV